MKRVVKAANSDKTVIKVIYMSDNNTTIPTLHSFTLTGTGYKETIMDAVDNYLNLPYLSLDFNEPDTFTVDRLIDAIQYYNEVDVDYDYIFKFEVNGEAIIDNTRPEERY